MLDQLLGGVSERYRLLDQVFTELLNRKDSIAPLVLLRSIVAMSKLWGLGVSSEGTIEIFKKITRPHSQKKAVGIPFIIMEYGGMVVEEGGLT